MDPLIPCLHILLPHSILWHRILDLVFTFYVSPQVIQILLQEGGLVFPLSSNLSARVYSIRPRNWEPLMIQILKKLHLITNLNEL